MSNKNFYEILKSTPTASFEELRRNYKELILQCHPDKLQNVDNIHNTTTTKTTSTNGDNTITIANNTATIKPATVDLNADTSISMSSTNEEFIVINNAWNTLKDPLKRRHYDAELLLRKFQTHSNIFARLTLDDMKRCAATKTTNRGSDSDSDNDSEVVCVDELEGNSAAGGMYWYYTYDCRCGGQYIVDESVDSEILNRNQNRMANVHSPRKTSEEQNATGNGDDEVLVECSECSLVIVLT